MLLANIKEFFKTFKKLQDRYLDMEVAMVGVIDINEINKATIKHYSQLNNILKHPFL